jgi:hypothetical protein
LYRSAGAPEARDADTIPAVTTFRLRSLPPGARFAVACFAVLLVGLHLTAQATLWASAGEGSLPSADQVLWKYHGHPQRTRLHEVLDLDQPPTSARAMFWYLDPTATPEDMTRIEVRRTAILSWVEAGAPRDGWPAVRQVLHEQASCLQCHAVGREKADVPLETYEDVRRHAEPGRGMAEGALLVSAHNHLFAFAVMALLLSLGVAFTTLRGRLTTLLVAAAFAGAALDVGGWFLTAAQGAPFQHLVVLGGTLFGLSTGAMIAALLDEVVLGGRVTSALRLAAREPATGA